MKTALITGIAGQDGSYLSELLQQKGYALHGVDKSSPENLSSPVSRAVEMHEVDLLKPGHLGKLIRKIAPDEIYHLAAHHFSSQEDGNRRMSLEPFNSINFLAANEILDSIRSGSKNSRFFYASSCQIFGKADKYPQDERTPYRPDSFYAITKAAGTQLCRFYREYHGVYASAGILYNHESVRRPLTFVTSQIAEGAARASLGIPVRLVLKNLRAVVDWGAAQDYVAAMWLTLQQPQPDDYVIASGAPHSVSDFAGIAFDKVGLRAGDFVFEDKAAVKDDASVPYVGDPAKIRERCGWRPLVSFEELVASMVRAFIDRLGKGEGAK